MTIEFTDPQEWPRHVIVARMRRAIQLLQISREQKCDSGWVVARDELLDEIADETPERHR